MAQQRARAEQLADRAHGEQGRREADAHTQAVKR